MKQLYRSDTNKIIAGIFGGLGEYYDVDPTVFRLLWVLVAVFSAGLPALLVYIIAYTIIPKRSAHN